MGEYYDQSLFGGLFIRLISPLFSVSPNEMILELQMFVQVYSYIRLMFLISRVVFHSSTVTILGCLFERVEEQV